MAEKYVKESKFLSYVLRHNPSSIGLKMDKEGWVNVELFIRAARENGQNFTHSTLNDIVESDSKGRYEYSGSMMYIRAAQGHSIEGLDLGFKETAPPKVLYHGTGDKYLASIMATGILKGNRHHVHLSEETITAMTVGARHGKPIAIVIDTSKMKADGVKFYKSNNGVWLTDHVDPKYFNSILTSIETCAKSK